jgi:hypothetical protein
MISKTTRPSIEVLAALLCATTASAQDNRGTPEQRAACTRRPSSVRQLHPGPNGAMPAAEHIRPQRSLQIGVRTSR